MFFISDDKNDNTNIYKVLDDESSKHLIIKSKPTQVLPTNEKNNTSITFNTKKINNNKLFNIKVKSKTSIKSQEWHHS